MEKEYYVYAYVRLDTNTFFYIGKGKNNRYIRLDNRKQHFMNIFNSVDCAVEILYDNLTEKDKSNAKRSKTQGTPIYCVELDMTFTSIRKVEEYFTKELNMVFCRKTFRKLMNGTYDKDWYKEIEINGIITKLHWVKLEKE